MSRAKLSISRELVLISGAVEALMLGAARPASPRHGNPDLASFASAVVGSLVVLRDRLRLVARVVGGEENPAHVISAENAAQHYESEGVDLVIDHWSASEQVRRCEKALGIASARLDQEQRAMAPLSTSTDLERFQRDDILRPAPGRRR